MLQILQVTLTVFLTAAVAGAAVLVVRLARIMDRLERRADATPDASHPEKGGVERD